jgi:hypothetical protein
MSDGFHARFVSELLERQERERMAHEQRLRENREKFLRDQAEALRVFDSGQTKERATVAQIHEHQLRAATTGNPFRLELSEIAKHVSDRKEALETLQRDPNGDFERKGDRVPALCWSQKLSRRLTEALTRPTSDEVARGLIKEAEEFLRESVAFSV